MHKKYISLFLVIYQKLKRSFVFLCLAHLNIEYKFPNFIVFSSELSKEYVCYSKGESIYFNV